MLRGKSPWIALGLLLALAAWPTPQPAGAAQAKKAAASIEALREAAKELRLLAKLVESNDVDSLCRKRVVSLSRRVRMIRADIERSGEDFSGLAVEASPGGQKSGLYRDAMDGLARMASSVDELFLLSAEFIVACHDKQAKDEAKELAGEIVKEARAMARDALLAAKLQRAYFYVFGKEASLAK